MGKKSLVNTKHLSTGFRCLSRSGSPSCLQNGTGSRISEDLSFKKWGKIWQQIWLKLTLILIINIIVFKTNDLMANIKYRSCQKLRDTSELPSFVTSTSFKRSSTASTVTTKSGTRLTGKYKLIWGLDNLSVRLPRGWRHHVNPGSAVPKSFSAQIYLEAPAPGPHEDPAIFSRELAKSCC